MSSLFLIPILLGSPTTRVPGDTNCDQKLDLSDAVTTLNYLFTGASAPPCPLEDPPELLSRIDQLEAETKELKTVIDEQATQIEELKTNRVLPDTNMQRCYGHGSEMSCSVVDNCQGQDAVYQTGCPMEGRFIDNQDGTVTDTCTNLMWQQNADDNHNVRLDSPLFVWCEALQYCADLTFQGYTDWRLPNIRELESLIDYGQIDGSALSAPFQSRFSCWSSTSLVNVGASFRAWQLVPSSYTAMWHEHKDVPYAVLAVRTVSN